MPKKLRERRWEEFKSEVKHRVTRFDFYEAVLAALMDTHPEIKEHRAIKDFFKREEEYRREIGRRGR